LAKSKPVVRKNGTILDTGAIQRMGLTKTYGSAAPEIAKSMEASSRQREELLTTMRTFDKIAAHGPELVIRDRATGSRS
jgi:hypothetical protein